MVDYRYKKGAAGDGQFLEFLVNFKNDRRFRDGHSCFNMFVMAVVVHIC